MCYFYSHMQRHNLQLGGHDDLQGESIIGKSVIGSFSSNSATSCNVVR